MRLQTPRIAPAPLESLDGEQSALLAPLMRDGAVLNVFSTLARKPAAAKAYLVWGRYVLRESRLDPVLRELAILRTAHLCRSGYEWAQHARLALRMGVTETDLARIKLGPDAEGWEDAQRIVLRAVDDVVSDHFISDSHWSALVSQFGEDSAMDLVFVIGHYVQTAIFLNCFGVQLE